MKVKISLLLGITALLMFTQCSKEFDTYYDRPAYLENPIYQELKALGNFSLYLQAVDRTLHAQVLKGAGLYTCFAPNDATFQLWLDEKNYASIADIPQKEVEDLVSYSLVYNKYTAENLGSALISKVWTPGTAYKYKTTFYPMLERDVWNGDSIWVVDANVQGNVSYNAKTNIVQNNKYLPVLTANYFNASSPSLSPQDYLTFFPGSVWCGTDPNNALANVGPASIIGGQHLAENGVFYEINKVIPLIPTISDYLEADTLNSDFWALVNYQLPDNGMMYFKNYLEVAAISDQYKLIFPDRNIDKVYIRTYSGMGVDPVAERYNGEGASPDVTQEGGNTIFVPTNAALQDYFSRKVLKYYPSGLSQVPMPVITTFMNAQVTASLVWPSYFYMEKNTTGEYLAGSAGTSMTLEDFGVTEKLMASNGIIYKTSQVIKSRWFESVYTEIFTNPNYSFLNLAFNLYYTGAMGMQEELMKCTLNGYENERHTVILYDDALLKADGFVFNQITNIFNHPTLGDANGATRLRRLINNGIFLGYRDTIAGNVYKGADLTPAVLAGTGLGSYDNWQFRVTNNGEMVRFKQNTMQMVGDVDESTSTVTSQIVLTPVEETTNGHVFKANRLMKYSRTTTTTVDSMYADRSLWYYLQLARKENPDVKSFVDLVEKMMKSTTSEDLLGVKASNFYTVLMPNNTAMNAAKNAGLYPSIIDPETDPKGTDKALRFVQSHFLVGRVFPDDNIPIIYPFSRLSDDPTQQVCPTLLTITSDRLGLVNEKTQVVAYKYYAGIGTTYSLRFFGKDIKVGNNVKVQGNPAFSLGPNSHLTVSRSRITSRADYKVTRSNRMACKAVLHEVNTYLNFVDK